MERLDGNCETRGNLGASVPTVLSTVTSDLVYLVEETELGEEF